MPGAKITALYCRLSHEDERLGESLSIEHQKDILLRYAKEHRFPNPVFYVDDGYSGTDFDRPAFRRMLAEIEAGRVGVLLTKDLSRLGRNSAMVGLYTTYTFPQNGVRYIAINDGFDTADQVSVSSDFAGIRNWFNEFFARDTSRKIRAVCRAKGERGIPLTVNVPYGYVRDPNDPRHWLTDPEAAEVVKRIFSLCMEGRGPHQIGRQLAAERILNPTAYKKRNGIHTPGADPEDPCYWGDSTVSTILSRREYTGCTVNFRTYTNSLWDRKRRETPAEEQAVFPGTHEAIIDEDVFARVQEIRGQRHRMTRTGISSIFSGLVYCADCGQRMQYESMGNRRADQAFFDCSAHRKSRQIVCKGHYIRESVLKELVLSHIRLVTGYVLRHEAHFRKAMYERSREQAEAERRQLKKQLEREEKRISELERLLIRTYEDNAAGRLNDERYELLSGAYESEKKQLEGEAASLREALDAQEKQDASFEQLMQRLKTHAVGIEALDGYILHELLEAVYVEAPDRSSGRRTQAIRIHYNGIGFIPIQELMNEQAL